MPIILVGNAFTAVIWPKIGSVQKTMIVMLLSKVCFDKLCLSTTTSIVPTVAGNASRKEVKPQTQIMHYTTLQSR